MQMALNISLVAENPVVAGGAWPVASNNRITDDSNTRVTDSGDTRVTDS